LEAVNPAAAKQFLKDAISMCGRMIHTPSGKLDSQKYDRDGQVRTPQRPFSSAPLLILMLFMSSASILLIGLL